MKENGGLGGKKTEKKNWQKNECMKRGNEAPKVTLEPRETSERHSGGHRGQQAEKPPGQTRAPKVTGQAKGAYSADTVSGRRITKKDLDAEDKPKSAIMQAKAN